MREMIAWLTKKYFQKRAFRVNRFKRNTLVDQEKILAKLLAKARNTTYGIRYNFSNISNLLDFQKQVPIVHYEDIAPFIEEMIIGKSNVLWPGTVPFFSKSSGTTNDVSKYIPVSRDSLYKNHYLAGKDMFSIYFSLYPNSNLFKNTGSMISLGGSFETNNQGIKIGDISAILMSEAPSWAQHYRQPSLPIALMKKWKEKIPAIIDETYKKI